jgi:16S rRNA processing protein RimM
MATGNGDRAGDLVLLGRIAGAQGLKGEVRINSFTANPEDIAAYGPLTGADGRQFVVERVRHLKDGAVVALLAGVTDRGAAEALRGTELYVAREQLPETDTDEWYYEELVGLKAVSPEGAVLGEVLSVQNFGAGDLLEIREADKRQSRFVPFTQGVVPVVDVKAGQLILRMPEEEDGEQRGGGASETAMGE